MMAARGPLCSGHVCQLYPGDHGHSRHAKQVRRILPEGAWKEVNHNMADRPARAHNMAAAAASAGVVVVAYLGAQ